MCLIGNYHDIGPFGEDIKRTLSLLRIELLYRREYYPTSRDSEKFLQVISIHCLDWFLPQERDTVPKGCEKLFIEIISIREDHNSRVLHLRLDDQSSSIKYHRE